jgi:hypothetical protein
VFVLAAPLVVVAALARRGTTRDRLLRALAAAAASAVLLVPWLGWTHHVVGRATMSVWGEGYNLALAAYGEGRGTTAADVEADPAFRARMEEIRRTLPSARELAADPTAHPRYLSRADQRLRSAAWSRYRERLRDEPLDVVGDWVYRMWFLWAAHEDWSQPDALSVPFVVLDLLLLALALAGSALALARGGAARPVVVFLLAYTLFLSTHHVEARFGIPLRGLYLALVAVALAEATGGLRGRRADQ